MKIIVLAGGTGTGLWPISRIFNPKQFIKLNDMSKSSFQNTIEKCAASVLLEDIIIVTNEEYKYFVFGQLNEIGLQIPERNILFEPSFKNTLHAVSMGVFELINREYSDVSDILMIPSNSMALDYGKIFKGIKAFSGGCLPVLLAFGIKASGAYTGYGYLNAGRNCGDYFAVDKFIEKPDQDEAEDLIRNGFMYNSGVLYFDKNIFLSELERYEPELYGYFSENDLKGAYSIPVHTTVEHSILCNSDRLGVIPLNEQWDNINEFSNFYKQYNKKCDRDGNIAFNENVFIEAENNLVYAEGDKIVSIVGCSDLIVIDQPDALLVCKSSDTSKVRDVAQILKKRNDPRADYHTTCYRPWGSYTVLEEGSWYKIKRITVLPGKKLSYQMHYHRSEHWIVVKGTANVMKNDHEYVVRSGESIFLSIGEKHRLENPGKTLLEVIEVQIGSYLEEDDIVRFEDDYGRG